MDALADCNASASELALRLRVEELYARYAACLDAGNFEQWPDFFTDECIYKVIPRENYERGLPLAILAFESKGMLKDRVYSITQTLFHQPYYQRHLVTGILIQRDGDAVRCEANYLVIRTKNMEPSEVFNCGRYVDRLEQKAGEWKFAQKLCVFDSELIPNSIIYPI